MIISVDGVINMEISLKVRQPETLICKTVWEKLLKHKSYIFGSVWGRLSAAA